MLGSPHRASHLGRLRRGAAAVWLGLCLAGTCACDSRRSPIVISEFLASNTSGLRDSDGETSDWIELHNGGTAPADLEGWCLTDDPHLIERWCFPAVSIAARGYLIVFASGKRTSGPNTELHATFRLKAAKDYLALLRPGGGVADAFAPYPEQKENVSFGLTPRGTKDYLGLPTPGAPNP